MDDESLEEMRRESRGGMVIASILVVTFVAVMLCLGSWGVWRLVQWLG
jgi:cytochrome oxidase assembly protein ShyY1